MSLVQWFYFILVFVYWYTFITTHPAIREPRDAGRLTHWKISAHFVCLNFCANISTLPLSCSVQSLFIFYFSSQFEIAIEICNFNLYDIYIYIL